MPAPFPTDDHGAPTTSLDAVVVRSLARLTGGDLADVAGAVDPPPNVISTLRSAERAEVAGVLIHALRRWHEPR